MPAGISDAATSASKAAELPQGLVEPRPLARSLAEERLDVVDACDRLVDAAVASRLVGAEEDQVALPLVGREQLADAAGGRAMRVAGDLGHHARQAPEHVDGRPAVARAERALEHDVTVEDAAHLVG